MPVVVFAISIAILIAVSIFTVIGLLNVFESRTLEAQAPAPALLDTEQLPPSGPRLQANPVRDLQELRVADEATLSTYGWVDKEAGRVRIPIDRAMELILERGLPVREDAPAE
jgi:hypothetical protein